MIAGVRLRRQTRATAHLRWRTSMIVGAGLITVILVGVVFSSLLEPYSPTKQDLSASLVPPIFAGGTARHLLGTDLLGRDVWSQLLTGGRVSLLIAAVALSIQVSLGTVLGLLAGYLGGWVDQLIMRIADIQFALPGLVALLAAVAIFGPSVTKLILFLGIAGWPIYARVVRGQVLSLREQDFIEAARALGATRRRIMLHHILPNILTTLIILATISVPDVILAEATLSFLGLGVPPQTPTWGSLVNAGQPYISTAWWISVFPGLAILTLVLSINLVGDGLRDLLDPRVRRQVAR
jgi:peptide/nickel transport system permease protein